MTTNLSRSRHTFLENSHEYNMLIKIRDLVYHQSGLYFSETKFASLQKKIFHRIKSLNLNSLKEYYYYINYDHEEKPEVTNLFDSLTNNEPCFFRDMPQLKAFQNQIMSDLMDRKAQDGQKTIRILSCGCSTGEEAYTLAILILEKLGKNIDQWHFEIKGGDMNPSALKEAQEGIYNQYALRNTSEKIINQYLTSLGNDSFSINENIRRMVHFFHLNLQDESIMNSISPTDIMLCRNVLIYFNETSKKNAIAKFYDIITPHGYLFVGPSESLSGISQSFKLLLLPGALVYKKEI